MVKLVQFISVIATKSNTRKIQTPLDNLSGNKLGADWNEIVARGRNLALNGTQGEVGVSLIKENDFF